MIRHGPALAGLTLALASPVAAAQHAADSLTTAGVYRAAAVVDAVLIDRVRPEATVGPGDFGAYLLARLGVLPIPPDLKLRVAVDTGGVVLEGRIADLPEEARRELGPLLNMFPLQTAVSGFIRLEKVAREVVRFRLARITINGVPIPEPLFASVMFDVGRRYPVLTRTGRDLLVEVPRDAEVLLESGRVRLIGPPATSPVPGR